MGIKVEGSGIDNRSGSGNECKSESERERVRGIN